MITNMEMPNVEMSNLNKDEERELQNAYRFMKNHEELIKILKEIMENTRKFIKEREKTLMNRERRSRRIHKLILKIIHDEYNISDEELNIICKDSIKKHVWDKPLDFESLNTRLPNLDAEDPLYMKKIEKLYFSEEDTRVKHQRDKDKTKRLNTSEKSKKQQIKHEECKSDLHIMLLKEIINLHTEVTCWLNKIIKLHRDIEWWQQNFEKSRIKRMLKKQKTEIELMKLGTKVIKLQNLCNSYEKEKTNLLLQLKNDKTSGTESFNASTSKKNIFQEKSQQISSDINSISLNLQNTLREKVLKKQDSKNSDIDYIKLASVIWRQEMMREEEPTNTKMNITMGLLKQINNSLNKLLQNFEDKMKELNKYSVEMTLLEDPKTNGKSTIVEEQVPTFTKDLNKSNKADESLEQVDKDALTKLFTDSEQNMNKKDE